MANVIDGSHRTLTPVSRIIGATTTDRNGATLGSVVELMVEAGTGKIVYAALSVGGLLGVGERLFAIPWESFHIETETNKLSLAVSRAELEITSGFAKDAWPTEPDAALRR